MDTRPLATQTFQQQKILGIIWSIFGLVCIAKAVFLAMVSSTLTLMWGALLNRVADPFTWMSLFHFAFMVSLVYLAVAAVFALLVGISQMGKPVPDRGLVIATGLLALPTGPLGLALGVYTIALFVPRSVAESQSRLSTAA